MRSRLWKNQPHRSAPNAFEEKTQVLRGQWKPNLKTGVARFRIHLNGPPVLLDNSLHGI